MEELKAGKSDGPQIRNLINNPIFDKALSEAELSAWQSLMSVVTEYEKEIEELLNNFRQFGYEC